VNASPTKVMFDRAALVRLMVGRGFARARLVRMGSSRVGGVACEGLRHDSSTAESRYNSFAHSKVVRLSLVGCLHRYC
jgi:hypothetical protein